MTFPRYPRYKDSGVEWLGEVPEHWRLLSARHLGRFSASGIDKKSSDDEVPVRMINFVDVYHSQSKVIDCQSTLMETTAPEEKASVHCVADGDLIITPSSEDANDIGHVARVINAEAGVVYSYHVLRYRLGSELDPVFATYFVNSAGVRSYFSSACTGTTRMTLDRGDFKSTCFAVPPPEEQSAIAAFLDRETGKIDALVGEQRRLIALLKEKRQAVISHAVTKGLNPNAPMKPSGIEWLGDVPEHWEVVALKRIADIQTGIAKGKDYGSKETIAVPYIRVANVQDGYLDLKTITTIHIPPSDVERYRLRDGDVLMNEGGDYDKLGRGCVWNGQIDPCIHQNHVFAVRPRGASPAWVSAIIGSQYAQFYFMTLSKQSTNLASISSRNLMELPVVVPPASDQEAVLNYIGRTSRSFDTLTTEAERAIDLLQERRTALISAAVTGKIDVRERAPSTKPDQLAEATR